MDKNELKPQYEFLDNKGTFRLEQPENTSYLYFPIVGEQGIKGALLPTLGGDLAGAQAAKGAVSGRSGGDFPEFCRAALAYRLREPDRKRERRIQDCSCIHRRRQAQGAEVTIPLQEITPLDPNRTHEIIVELI